MLTKSSTLITGGKGSFSHTFALMVLENIIHNV